MKIQIKEVNTGKSVDAMILPAERDVLPLKKNGWQFNWKILSKTDGSLFYKLVKQQTPTEIEGMLMLTLLNEEMVYMNNIEVAPHNYGRNGRFEGVAGCLIAYACKKSLELGKGYYTGFLTFESKTELISLYEEKYGATWAIGQKMFITPESGKILMNRYLGINI